MKDTTVKLSTLIIFIFMIVSVNFCAWWAAVNWNSNSPNCPKYMYSIWNHPHECELCKHEDDRVFKLPKKLLDPDLGRDF